MGAVTTDENGEAIFTVSSSTVGVEEFTATDVTDGNLVITQTASVEFTEVIVVGAVDANVSTVGASPTGVVADGISLSTITVTLKDANGNPVEGKDVTLANTAGSGMAVIDPLTAQTTDANGEASFTVRSGIVGVEEFTATDVSDGNLVITQTASVQFVDLDRPLTLNVNFNGFTPGVGPPEVESTLEGPAGGLGTTWNQFAANSSTGPLVDTIGVPTTVEFTTNFSEGRYNGTGPDLTMLRTALTDFGRGAERNLTITGLDAGGTYDIWLVGYRDSGAARERIVGNWATANSTTSSSDQLIDNRPNNDGSIFVDGYNYVLFENVVADGSGAISFDGKGATILDGFDDDYRHGLNGFQIQQAAPAAPFAITKIAYSASTDEVTLTWRSRPDTSYIAKYSLTMADGDWGADMGDGITSAIDEIPGDGDQITVTFDLDAAGVAAEENVFFRIEEE